MAIAITQISKSTIGNKRLVTGKYVLSGTVTTGSVETGLEVIESITFTPYHASAGRPLAPSIEETLPYAGSSVTLNTNQDETGYFTAIGY